MNNQNLNNTTSPLLSADCIRFGLVFIIFLMKICLGNDHQLFPTKNLFQHDKIRNSPRSSFYDISNNPAFFRNTYTQNHTLYSIRAGRNINNYSRQFDPKRKDNLFFRFNWIKQLNKNSTLAAEVKYNINYLSDVYRSLEKNYYNNYFSVTDTTTGNFNYQGPELWLLYNHSINNKLQIGLKLDYQIERGLKDTYTECETIYRNLATKIGIAYQYDQNTLLGLFYRYFNNYSRYEAVKEYEDAFIKTWFGYHINRPENPGGLINKHDYQLGNKIGLNLERKNIFAANFGIRFNISYGIQRNKIQVGPQHYLSNRGLWKREGYQFSSNLFYNSRYKLGFLYLIYNNFYDWASPHKYDVTLLDKNQEKIRLGGLFKSLLYPTFGFEFGFEFQAVTTYYEEYVANFRYYDIRNKNSLMIRFNYRFHNHIKFILGGAYSHSQPDFHWKENDIFKTTKIELGLEKSYVFGRIQINIRYTKQDPDNVGEIIETYGINCLYIK